MFENRDKLVFIFGAGATKACGGPLTNEILPDAVWTHASGLPQSEILNREDYLDIVRIFFADNFPLLAQLPGDPKPADFPALPLLLSLIDNALDRKEPFGGREGDDLVRVRSALEYLIFALLEFRLRHVSDDYKTFHYPLEMVPRIGAQEFPNAYYSVLEKAVDNTKKAPYAISLNYDIIADNTFAALSDSRTSRTHDLPENTFSSYECDVATRSYREVPAKFGKLLKLHGSLNWMYCPSCHRLDLAISKDGKRFVKALNNLFQETQQQSRAELRYQDLESRYRCHGAPCANCGHFVRPVMITPTQKKDYRNPHIARIWYEAERLLREASRVVFVGYSMPEDDVEVVYLLKRGLSDLAASRITVVEYAHPDGDGRLPQLAEHSTGVRYRALFGDGIDWHPEGFSEWVKGWNP
jgi:hypothetical protein